MIIPRNRTCPAELPIHRLLAPVEPVELVLPLRANQVAPSNDAMSQRGNMSTRVARPEPVRVRLYAKHHEKYHLNSTSSMKKQTAAHCGPVHQVSVSIYPLYLSLVPRALGRSWRPGRPAAHREVFFFFFNIHMAAGESDWEMLVAFKFAVRSISYVYSYAPSLIRPARPKLTTLLPGVFHSDMPQCPAIHVLFLPHPAPPHLPLFKHMSMRLG